MTSQTLTGSLEVIKCCVFGQDIASVAFGISTNRNTQIKRKTEVKARNSSFSKWTPLRFMDFYKNFFGRCLNAFFGERRSKCV